MITELHPEWLIWIFGYQYNISAFSTLFLALFSHYKTFITIILTLFSVIDYCLRSWLKWTHRRNLKSILWWQWKLVAAINLISRQCWKFITFLFFCTLIHFKAYWIEIWNSLKSSMMNCKLFINSVYICVQIRVLKM